MVEVDLVCLVGRPTEERRWKDDSSAEGCPAAHACRNCCLGVLVLAAGTTEKKR
jgi:hypothetical protein